MGVIKQGEDCVFSPVKGKYIHLKDVSDATFNSGVLGTGFAVDPKEDVIHAPVEGTISAVFPTGHAVGFTTDNGLEVLVHIGIDTVKLEGKYFTAHVKEGDMVKTGDLLVEFDPKAVMAEGYDTLRPGADPPSAT